MGFTINMPINWEILEKKISIVTAIIFIVGSTQLEPGVARGFPEVGTFQF